MARWYVGVPPFVIISFLAALFFVASAGQARLQEAGERLQTSATREHAVDRLQDSLSRSLAAQRAWLLTGEDQYRGFYERDAAALAPRSEDLREAYAGSQWAAAGMRNLQILIDKRAAEFATLMAVKQKAGTATAVALLRSGSDTGAAISEALDKLRDKEAAERWQADRHWDGSLTLSRWITIVGTVVNMLLVAVATRLVYMELRRRNVLTEELRDQKLRLERQVEDRTRELVELSTHLQSLAEREKANLARELHDELGGLLVGARMDISWAEQHLAHDDADMRRRLHRVQQNLCAGVDLKRRIIEELRPTLLDNVGLFAALRWQFKESCRNAGLQCTEAYPDEEPRFDAGAAIALFRIAQEAFTNILKHAEATCVDMSVGLDQETLLMRIADNGKGIPDGRFNAIASHGLASMRHRVRALGGRLDVHSAGPGGTLLLVQLPIANALSGAAEIAAT